ncbi:MAG: protein kinase [Planctomycetes bacterium]|nr:protein kinase [Planctomycetota bacterium]
MASVKCPYCENQFEWTESMGVGDVQCPLCGKTLRVVQERGEKGTQNLARPQTTTAWGTEGFRSPDRRAKYGEIKKGDVLGGFRVEELVGVGAMAAVYSATQLSLDRIVALKILPQEFAERKSFVRQFDSETSLLASLNHPNIVNIIDRGCDRGIYYFAMEFVEGATLGDLLASQEIDEEFFLQIIEQCAEALVYAHGMGIMHRDLKPANIMLNEQGIVKVADFGVAGLLAEARADPRRKKRVMGTRGFMPPEQEIHISNTDERSDIFSLGAVMYRLLGGRLTEKLPPPPPSELSPQNDPRIDSLVIKCLKPNPDDRYQSARELLDAIQAYHHQISAVQEVCPNCKKENPITQTTCVHCGADLSELFDTCPQCGAQNRIDVELCMKCGANLKQLRRQTSVQISKTEEDARKLARQHKYDQAIETLQGLTEIKGRMFEQARRRAARLIADCKEKRNQHYQQKLEESKRLAREGALSEALELLQSMPGNFAASKSLNTYIENVQAQMTLAQKKLQEASNLLLRNRVRQAAEILKKVEKTWPKCPGIDDLKQELDNLRQTQQMIEYQLDEARRQMLAGELAQAHQSIEFALSTNPDNPKVKRFVRQLQLTQTLTTAKEAYQQSRYEDAVAAWRKAYAQLPADDERRAMLEENIKTALAKRQHSDEQIPPEPAPPEPSASPARSFLFDWRVIMVLAIVMGAALVAFGLFLLSR